jgi:hypothetical protein
MTAVVGLALTARHLVSEGPSFIPPIDNPVALLIAPHRALSALWIQVLYVARCLVPTTLSADYSYQQIPLVMGLHDPRALAGLGLVTAAVLAARFHPPARLPLALWVVPCLATANVLFAIGTMMAERLVYLPSLGLCLGAAMLLVGIRPPVAFPAALLAIALAFGARTAVRTMHWSDADAFYPKLVTAPQSARAWYSLGVCTSRAAATPRRCPPSTARSRSSPPTPRRSTTAGTCSSRSAVSRRRRRAVARRCASTPGILALARACSRWSRASGSCRSVENSGKMEKWLGRIFSGS